VKAEAANTPETNVPTVRARILDAVMLILIPVRAEQVGSM
jgi:hypothetical protein